MQTLSVRSITGQVNQNILPSETWFEVKQGEPAEGYKVDKAIWVVVQPLANFPAVFFIFVTLIFVMEMENTNAKS